MLKFSELSEKRIKDFAGNVIFNRGYDYYHDGLVEDFEFDPKKQTFCASIHGSLGYYTIEVCNNDDYLEANCDCPFDGYPCKHIVAVLLYFLDNKDNYLKDLNAQRKMEKIVEDKLSVLPKKQLIQIILSLLQKYPSVRRELILQLSDDKQTSLKQFFKAIAQILRTFENREFSTYEISHNLKGIMKQAESADDDIKVEIIWKITDGVLNQLNQYGISDIPLENIAIETMGILVDLLNNNPGLNERRKEIQSELEEYCEWGNCGIVDFICDAAFEISDDNKQ